MNIYHVPGNEEKIDEIYVALSVDEKGEGIITVIPDSVGIAMPVIFGHKRMLDTVKKMLKKMAIETGTKIQLVKFNKDEIVEEFDSRN